MAKQKLKTKEMELAIKYLHEVKRSTTKEIALELGVAEAIVDGVINQTPEEKPKRVSKSQDLMQRQTAAKKINNVSIMTQAASQLNDEMVKKLNSDGQSRMSKGAIFRPNGE